MALPVVIPNTFANANASIPLSQLDNNFSTVAVAINGMANGAEALANVNITGGSIANASLSNVSISSGNVTINVANVTTLDATNVEVTNIKAKDGTASATIADSTGVMTIGSSVLTTTDINGGTIDGTAIGGTTPAAGAFTTLSATGNATLSNSTAEIQFTGATYGWLRATVGDLYVDAPTAKSIFLRNAGSTIANISSTGLAVTGAISSTSTATFGSILTNSEFSFSGTNTLAAPVRFASGALAQPLIFYTGQFGVDAAEVARVSSTGLAVTGALSTSTNLTVTGGTITTGSTTSLSLATSGGVNSTFINIASAVNYLEHRASATTGSPGIAARGSDTNVGFSYDTQAAGAHVFTTGTLSATQVVIAHTASAVNYLTLTGSATGNATLIGAAGSDTNIALALTSKGAGAVGFYTGYASVQQVSINHTASANRYITLTGSNGGNPTISVSAGELAVGTNAWTFGVANSVSPTSPNRTLTVTIGGTTYYIAAKTTND